MSHMGVVSSLQRYTVMLLLTVQQQNVAEYLPHGNNNPPNFHYLLFMLVAAIHYGLQESATPVVVLRKYSLVARIWSAL